MKLHLPIALLAAVLSTFTYAETVEYKYYVDNQEVSRTDDNLSDGVFNGHVQTTFTGDWTGKTLGGNYTTAGFVGAIDPTFTETGTSGKGSKVYAVGSSDLILDGARASIAVAGGPSSYNVIGDKTLSLKDGSYVTTIYAAYYYPSGAEQTPVNTDLFDKHNNNYFANGNSDAVIKVNLTDSSATQIFAGSYYGNDKTVAVNDSYELNDPAWAINEKIEVNIHNSNVGYTASGKPHPTLEENPDYNAIMTGGYKSACALNGGVAINVSGDSHIVGSIYAGGSTYGEIDSYVKSAEVTLTGGRVDGNIVAGGWGEEQAQAYVNEGTKVVLAGGEISGNVYAGGAGYDTVKNGTHVVVQGKGTQLGENSKVYGGGMDETSKVEGDRVLTFDNHGEVAWDKFENFNAVEFTNTTITKLGTDGVLAENYEKVVIDNSHITGRIDHAVELDVTNNIKVDLAGDLITKADSEIVNNENAIQIGRDATFNDTEIKNSTIVAGGNISITSGSSVTDANLVAANGQISVNGGSTIDGGEITVGKQGLSLGASDVKVDKINGVDELLLQTQNDWSLEVNDDLKLAEGSALRGFGLGENIWAYGELKADSVSIESGLKGVLYAVNIEAKDGDIVIGSGNDVQVSHLTASDSVILKDGASLTHGSTATAQTGDVWLNGGVKVENSDLIAENGIVKFNTSTMNGGKIVAGEALQMDDASVVVADSINNGEAVKLDVNSGGYFVGGQSPTAASLTVNDDLVLADGSRFEGHNKIEMPGVNIAGDDNVNALLTAHSITTKGKVTFDRATVKAEEGNIELANGSKVTNTNLVAKDSVQLNGTTMKGGSIAAGNKVVLDKSVVSVNSIGTVGTDGTIVTDGAVVKSTNSQLEVTQGALVLNSGSEVTNSSLTATNGDVVLSGTKMSGSTVTTNGEFFIKDNSEVTMGTLEGLNNIHISDSSLSTEKLVVNNGETFKVTGDGVDRTGDKLILSGTGVALEEAFVVNGEATIKDATLVITGSNSQLGIAYGANGGKLVIDGSNVDMHEASTLHMGYNAGEAGELIITNGSNFLSASNNAWLGGGKVEVSNGSTLDVCNSENSYNYRTIMGWEGHTLDVKVQSGELGASTFNSAASQLITNYHSDTKVNILVDGQDSSFNHAGTIVSNSSYAIGATGEWVEKDGKWYDKGTLGLVGSGNGTKHTLTYLLDAGTDEYGAKKAAVNNVFTTITAQNGGSVNIDSAITYVGGFQDVATFGKELNKQLNLNVGEESSMSFNRMEVYANTNVANDGSFKATDINVHDGATFNYAGSGTLTANSLGVANGGVMNLGSDTVGSKVMLNVAGSGQSGVISGKLNVTNTDLVVSGGSSQFWIDGGTMTVDGKSKVDLSAGTTLRVGNENAGVLNVQGGSTLIGGANNLWVYDNSTINVSGEGTVMSVCNDTDYYNYRVLMGITNHDGADGTNAMQKLNVTDGATFTSSATQFVTNFHSGTKTFITADGGTFVQTGTNMNGSHYEVGTTGEWKQDKDGNWLDAGSAGVGGQYVTGNTDTITYLLSNGTDKNGVLGYPVSNAQVAIGAINGGTVKFDSALTYVGNVGVSDEYIKANENNTAHFGVDETSNMSFKQMEVYANAAIKSHYTEGKTTGTFTATGMNIHNGANVSLSAIKEGAMGSALVTGHLTVNGKLDVIGSHLNVVGSSSQVAIGYGDSGIMNVKDSVVDISNAQTLHIGYEPLTKEQQKNTQLNIVNSTFKGGSQNAWLGGGTINVEKSHMEVCTGNGTSNNYRVLMGLSGNTVNLNVTDGSTFKSEASRFVTNYQDGSTVNIVVDNSTFTQAAQARVGKDKEGNPIMEDSITYLADRGVDNHGKPIVNETYPQGLVNNVETNITAKNGGVVNFESKNTYIGNALDREYGYTNKQVNLSVGEGSSMSFKHMEIFADTKIENHGTFNVESVNVNDGATLETLGSLDLNEVALAGGTLFNQGSLSMDSLELEHASLLFAATSLTDASAAINYTGTHLTNFGPNGSSVSINDMIDSFGIDLGGAGADTLIAAGDEGVDFSFTLATGETTFLSQLQIVLSTEENLAQFSITVGDAVLRLGDGELKNLQVTVDGEALVVSGTAIIPEPTTATLSLLALAALAARRRRK